MSHDFPKGHLWQVTGFAVVSARAVIRRCHARRLAQLLRRGFAPHLYASCDCVPYWQVLVKLRGTLKKCVNSQAVYPLSEQHGLEAQERR